VPESKPSTKPEDFDEVIQRPGVLVVGGHAVNLWASYYAPRGDPTLVQYAPFRSKDADIFVREKEQAIDLANSAGWKFRNNPEPRTTVLGHIHTVKHGQELTVDVLRSVQGLTEADLSAVETVQFEGGKNYSIPSPEIMLKAKLSNLANIEQVDRPDLRHVRIMIVCCRHYLTDVYQAVLSREIAERDAVDRFMDTLRIIRSVQAQEMGQKFDLRLNEAIPARESLKELPRLPRLLAFYDHQMRQKQGPRASM
jgi:hypothetical protein